MCDENNVRNFWCKLDVLLNGCTEFKICTNMYVLHPLKYLILIDMLLVFDLEIISNSSETVLGIVFSTKNLLSFMVCYKK